MIVKQTNNIDLVRQLLCSPEIFDLITDDDCKNHEDLKTPIDYEYIIGIVNDEIIGVMVYHHHNNLLYCHIQVLPRYRKAHAREFARMALEFGKAKNVDIYAEIATRHPNVKRFAESFGFEVIETIKDGHIKCGVAYDVNILRLSWG